MWTKNRLRDTFLAIRDSISNFSKPKTKNKTMSIKTVNSITKQKIDNLSTSTIMLAAKTWEPKQTRRYGRVSVLESHIDTIRYLRGARKMTFKNISEFLNEQGIKVSYANVVAFATKNKIGGGNKKKKEEKV